MVSNWIKMAIFAVLLIMLAIIPLGLSLKCYQCHSKLDSVCAGDLPANPSSTDPGFKYLVDCDTQGNRTHISPAYANNPFILCRKQRQEIDEKVQIIRSCGVVEENSRPCYSTANPPTKTYVCQCKTDGCNSANNLPVSLVASIVLPIVAFMLQH
jgi:hypothetical protein